MRKAAPHGRPFRDAEGRDARLPQPGEPLGGGAQRGAQRAHLLALFLDGAAQLLLSAGQGHLLRHHQPQLFVRRRDLVQPGPAHWVIPGAADRAVAIVHRACGRVFPGKRITRIESPQPPIGAQPRVVGAQQPWHAPGLVLAGAERYPVAARIVDKRDAEQVRARLFQTRLLG
mgnify:CR=1 FL=1